MLYVGAVVTGFAFGYMACRWNTARPKRESARPLHVHACYFVDTPHETFITWNEEGRYYEITGFAIMTIATFDEIMSR